MVGSNDLTARTGGFAAGADYRYAPGSVLGVAVAIGETNWGLASGLGKGNTDVAQVGGYFSTRWNDMYVSGAVAGCLVQRQDRPLSCSSPALDHLRADFDAHSFGARLEGGWRYGTTAVRRDALCGRTGAERVDAGLWRRRGLRLERVRPDLRGADHDRHPHRARRLARYPPYLEQRHAACCCAGAPPGCTTSIPTAASARFFQALPGASFVVDGARAAEDAALLSAAAELRLANGVTLIGKFDGEFADGSQTYAGTGTIRYAW